MRVKHLLLLLPLLLAFTGTSFAAQHFIKISVGSGGTVSPQKGKLLVEGGESPTVTYTALDNYYLAEVQVDKVPVAINHRKTFTYQFNNVQADHAIAAKFLKDPVITAKESKGGTVTPSGKLFVPYSTSKSFSFAPQEGYHLASVVVDKVNLGTPDSYTFNHVKTKHSLSVNFAINSYDVTTQAGYGGFVAPASLPPVKHGQKKVFTVKPDKGMRVASVTVNGTPVTGPLPPSGPYKLPLTITGETLIAATFTDIVASGSSRLYGTYQLVGDESSFRTETGNPFISEPIAANRITASFDGKGSCQIIVNGASYSETINPTNGSQSVMVVANESPTACSYTVDDNGMFTLNLTTPGGTETIKGWVSTDSNVALFGGFGQSSGGNWHQYTASTVTGIRSGSGISRAKFAGTYHLVDRDSFLWESPLQAGGTTYIEDNYSGDHITVTFNANGSCNVHEKGVDFSKKTDNVNNEFVKLYPWDVLSSSCSYTINSNGTFTLTIIEDGDPFTVNGWSSADGNTMITGGAEQLPFLNGTDYAAEHAFGVRAGSNMNAASINGTYQIIGSDFRFRTSMVDGTSHVDRVLSGRQVTATFDGAGQCTLSYTGEGYFKNMVNGIPVVKVDSDSGTMSACSYTVAPDGAFTLELTDQNGNDTLTGWISADGSTVLMGGPSQSIDDFNNDIYESSLMVGTKVK